MSKREHSRLRVYNQDSADYNLINSIDSEIMEIASPPIGIYCFNLLETVKDKASPRDELYNEIDIIDDEALLQLYKQGFNGDFSPSLVRDGEKFDKAVYVPGYYQEPTWTQELTRLGIEDIEEELAINFNYQTMLSRLGKEIRIGDIIKTFRGKVYRALDCYVSDEIIGWKYLHYHVICKKVPGLDRIILPADNSAAVD